MRFISLHVQFTSVIDRNLSLLYKHSIESDSIVDFKAQNKVRKRH